MMTRVGNHLGALAAVAGMLAAVGSLMLMLVVVDARRAEATFPGLPGNIAYTGFDGTDKEIYTITPGGTPFQLTNNNTLDDNPSYSPDGTKIAYTGFDGTDTEIYTVNASGGTASKVTDNDTPDFQPSYSPDGKKIAYVGLDTVGDDLEIYTINATGGAVYNVTNTKMDDFSPSYSPDGKKIAFSHHGVLATDYEIWTINATGGRGRVKVTDNDTHDGYPDYSPNGTKIAYTGFDGTDDEIYTINVGGGTPSESPTIIGPTPSLPTRPTVRRSPTRATTEPTPKSTRLMSAEGPRSKSPTMIRTMVALPGGVGRPRKVGEDEDQSIVGFRPYEGHGSFAHRLAHPARGGSRPFDGVFVAAAIPAREACLGSAHTTRFYGHARHGR